MACPQNTPCGHAKERPLPTLADIKSAAKAILLSKRASPAVINARLAICAACELQNTNKVGYRWCDACHCFVDGRKGLTNLASYEENLPELPGYNPVLGDHGCHFPGRLEGKGGWPLPTTVTPIPPAPAPTANSELPSPNHSVQP